MKTRLDYVSNSSSSSFMLVGNVYDTEELAAALEKRFPEEMADILADREDFAAKGNDPADYEYDFDDYDINIDKLLEKFGLKYRAGLETYEDQICIGLPFNDMGEDETKRQFKARVAGSLKKLFGKKETVKIIEDKGYI